MKKILLTIVLMIGVSGYAQSNKPCFEPGPLGHTNIQKRAMKAGFCNIELYKEYVAKQNGHALSKYAVIKYGTGLSTGYGGHYADHNTVIIARKQDSIIELLKVINAKLDNK